MQLKTINLLSKMKIVKKLTLPVLVSLVMGLASCSSDDDTVHYSTNSLKNTELMTVLKSKGYQFDKDGKLELNDLAEKTTALDLSGTKLKDFSGLDILPNLKDVKLSNNGYGPVFDFAQLPAQITGVDLTGNDIHNYKNLVDVKVEENEEETIKNLHNITKLYLPAEAKYNVKDLVRFYRKNKEDIASGKIDMKMADEKGNLQKYNTLRNIPNKKVLDVIKESFSSIMSSDGNQIDLSKRLNNEEKVNDFGLYVEKESASTFLDGIQYIIENPYWEGTTISIQSFANTHSLPYMEVGSKVQTFILRNVKTKGICYDYAHNLTSLWFASVSGVSDIDISHSTLFGQRDPKLEEDGEGASALLLVDCPDLVSLKYPERNDLCVSSIEYIDLPKLSNADLTPFKQITSFCFSALPSNCKITYPNLRSFPSAKPYKTAFGCNEEIFMRPETIDFIKKYYINSDPKKLTSLTSALGADKLTGEKELIFWSFLEKYLNKLK